MGRPPAPAGLEGFPVLLSELVRLEALVQEETGRTLVFSDGSAGEVLWNLSGLRAGVFAVRIVRGSSPLLTIRLNRTLLARVGEGAFLQTVAHEYAHAVVWALLQARGRIRKGDREEFRPHGTLWRSVMERFGHPPERCHAYPVEKIRTVRSFPYRCGACRREYRLGAIRHRRLEKHPGYLVCGTCRGTLGPVPELIRDSTSQDT